MGDAAVLRDVQPVSGKGTSGKRAPRPPKPHLGEMAEGVARFLTAAGLSLDDPHLAGTPERVARAWAAEYLDGYRVTPEAALGETFEVPHQPGAMVVMTDLRFHSMCPHHLLPYAGRAHLAYVPAGKVVGFGRLSALVDCFAHRLILQEDLAREIAQSLARVLGSPATACILEAEQACLRLRADGQRDAKTHAESYQGLLQEDGPLRRELWARLGSRR